MVLLRYFKHRFSLDELAWITFNPLILRAGRSARSATTRRRGGQGGREDNQERNKKIR